VRRSCSPGATTAPDSILPNTSLVVSVAVVAVLVVPDVEVVVVVLVLVLVVVAPPARQ
jgi:hypothetical protein